MSATSQGGFAKSIPGLILCMVLGWLALQWDYSVRGWQKDFKECQKIVKTSAEGVGSTAPVEEPLPEEALPKEPLPEEALPEEALPEEALPAEALPAEALPKEPLSEETLSPFDAYKAKHAEKYKEQLALYEQGVLKKKPKKPHILKQDVYESLIATNEIPFKFKFGVKMIQFQLTYVAVLLLGGMLIRNTIGIPDIFKPGTVLARPIIKPGIVLLGGYYVWSNLFKVGLVALLLVIIFIFGTVVLVSFLGRKLKQDEGLIGVMAAGTGVCGVSAAVAVAPIVKAKPRDFFYAVGTLLLFGTLALFTFPYIGKALGMSEPVFGAWVGTSILNTAQLVAAASWYGHDSLLTANIINIVRVGFIPIVVLYCIWFYLVKGASAEGREEKMNAWQVIIDKFPLFILGFFAMVTLNEFGVFTKDHQYIFGKQFLKIFFAIGFAGVGLNIAFDDLKKAGGKAFVIGFFAASFKAILSAIIVILLGTAVFQVQ